MADIATPVIMFLFAAIALHSRMLRLSIIALAIFSLLGALLFLLYSAPELAIAEAVIGSALVTLLFLTALKRYPVFTIGVVSAFPDRLNDAHMLRTKYSSIFRHIRTFLLQREREAQLVFTQLTVNEAVREPHYDVVVEVGTDPVRIHGLVEDFMVVELEMSVEMHRDDIDEHIQFAFHTEDGQEQEQ
ncbi:MAG: Na(+)/H(+) antiporter subunit B [Spirochaetia bacterium]